MRALARLTVVETRLMLREVVPPLFTVLLPVALLLIFGWSGSNRQPADFLGGRRAIDTVIPSMALMVAMSMVAFFMLPTVLAAYREKGILRRFATTPVKPSVMLGAQLIMNGAVMLAATLLTLLVGVLLLGMRVPSLPVVLSVILLGIAGLFPIGLVVAAVASTAKAATGWAFLLYFPSAFFAGLYVPVEHMPAALRRIGDFTPLGAFRQAAQDTWSGLPPRPVHLIVLAVSFVVFGALAVRLFRASDR